MGYYVQTSKVFNKAEEIALKHDGIMSHCGPVSSYDAIPKDKALIVVIDNGVFEAAGFCYCPEEFKAFTEPGDNRPRKYVLIDRAVAERLTGF